MRVACIFLPPWDPKYPSYAIALFKASTKQAGHDFLGFDLNVDLYKAVPIEDQKLWGNQVANLWSVDYDKIIQKYSKYIDSYINKIIENKIDLYSISLMNSYSVNLALYIADKIKKQDSKAKILTGGPRCFPAYNGIDILKNEYVDAICTGEADLVWPKILEHFDKNKNLQIDIAGVCYKDNYGNIVDNGIPERVEDLNSIPFADYSDIDFIKYGNKYCFSIMTSRGCINTCAFCSDRTNYPKYRFRNAENVFNEIVKHLNDFHNNPTVPSDKRVKPHIAFNDLLINGVPKELERFCDMVISSGLEFSWGGMALIRKEMTYELFTKMKKAGCVSLAWGLESGCQEVLDLMQKQFFNMDLAKKVIKLAHEVGLKQSISLIAGFPGETEEMFLRTKEFLTEYKDYVMVGIQPMMIVTNSTVYDNIENFGIKAGNDWIKWQTIDGTNTYEVRLKRVEEIKSLLEGKLITLDK